MLSPASSSSKQNYRIYIIQTQEKQEEKSKGQKYRLLTKNLFHHLKSDLDLTGLNREEEYAIRKMFKYGFSKKIQKLAFDPWIFPSCLHRISKNLTQLTLKQRFTKLCRCHRHKTVYLELKKKPIVSVFESLKHLKQLRIIGDNIFLKEFRSIQGFFNLEVFSFQIYEHDIPSFYYLFRRLTRLQTVELIIRKGKTPPLFASKQRNMTWMFLKDLIKLKRLKTLKLSICNCVMTRNPHFFYQLLEIISENTNLETLDLTLDLINFKQDEKNKGANKVLAKVQSLCLNIWPEFSNQMFHSRVPGQKKICLSFSSNNQKNVMNLSSLITNCNELKNLALEDDGGNFAVSPKLCFNSKVKVMQVNISKYCDQKTLEFLGYLSNSSDSYHITSFNLELSHFTDDILKELIKINSLFSPNEIQGYSLKTHDTLSWQDTKFLKSHPKSDLYCLFIESLCQFTALQKLRLQVRIEDKDPLEMLEKSLSHLVNLVHLELEIYANQNLSTKTLFIDLPLHRLLNLQSLWINLSNSFRFKYFLEFLGKLVQLKEIQNINIPCFDIDLKDKKSLIKIKKILDKLPEFKGFKEYLNIWPI